MSGIYDPNYCSTRGGCPRYNGPSGTQLCPTECLSKGSAPVSTGPVLSPPPVSTGAYKQDGSLKILLLVAVAWIGAWIVYDMLKRK
jgi:hypothetical protein